jgi:hypothetical protein
VPKNTTNPFTERQLLCEAQETKEKTQNKTRKNFNENCKPNYSTQQQQQHSRNRRRNRERPKSRFCARKTKRKAQITNNIFYFPHFTATAAAVALKMQKGPGTLNYQIPSRTSSSSLSCVTYSCYEIIATEVIVCFCKLIIIRECNPSSPGD